MSSPEPQEAEMPPGSTVVSETGSAAKSHKAETTTKRRRRTQPSPFKVPDANSNFLLSLDEKGNQKEEMRNFPALPTDEKTTHAARAMAKLKNVLVRVTEEGEEAVEGSERRENLKPLKSKTGLPHGKPGRREPRTTMLKRESVARDSKHYLIYMQRQRAVFDRTVITRRSEMERQDKALAEDNRQLRQLESTMNRDELNFEEFLREKEKKSIEARTQFEQEAKIKMMKISEIKTLNAQIGTLESDIAKRQEVLTEYKSFQELLFELSPPEWKEEQRARALKAQVQPDQQGAQDGEPEEVPERTAVSAGGELPPITETGLSTAPSSTLNTNCQPEEDNSDYEDDPQLYFTEPWQFVEVETKRNAEILFQNENIARVEVTLADLQLPIKTTRKKHERELEKITAQINETKESIKKEKARAIELGNIFYIHASFSMEEQEMMLGAFSEKVAEVYHSCVDNRNTNLHTVEKLSNAERYMFLLQQNLESIPEDKLAIIRRIKDSERRSRQREEELREQEKKQRERADRYLTRSLAGSKKTVSRKLLPRFMPITQTAKVKTLDMVPAEDEIQEYLFGPEDLE